MIEISEMLYFTYNDFAANPTIENVINWGNKLGKDKTGTTIVYLIYLVDVVQIIWNIIITYIF